MRYNLYDTKRYPPADYPVDGCDHGSVRLTRRELEGRPGRVEICNEGSWQTVCSISESEYWDVNAASVVCRQLGFPGDGEYHSSCRAKFLWKSSNLYC